MNCQRFPLIPFSGLEAPADVALAATFSSSGQEAQIGFSLTGNIDRICIPAFSGGCAPQRRDRLWETTCFECFFGTRGDSGYWEFNLSPSGNWNVYRFADYRLGMTEETALAQLPFEVRRVAGRVDISLQIDFSIFGPISDALQGTFTTVIEERSGRISYWARAHTGAEADFHRRADFIDLTPA